ncbi:sap62 [Candida pseudojiufengensis]|uniref:sap62 n=1 Tax=Candida pseudojiufengensis TaxID=497109 RepID=UPI00222509C8|nr:sap62 [Candida pseudojiufengensis]KAI5963555.1 sap62 [Candida pseudojiufengensis]
MDYSGRVNSKKGAGGIASTEESNIYTKKRVQELLATHILDLDNDPYVFRNHLGILECKLCLTTHNNESSYISHLGGRKHHLNLERRRILDEKQNLQLKYQQKIENQISISNVEKRNWNKIGKPIDYKIIKIRDPKTLQIGFLISCKFPKIIIDEPFFTIMSFYELTSKNQNLCIKEITKLKKSENNEEHVEGAEDEVEEDEDDEEYEPTKFQYLIISAEPYDNIAIIIPNKNEIDKPQDENKMSDTYWWYWDKDTKEFYLQFLYKN